METAGIIFVLFCFIYFIYDVLNWLPVQFDGERERRRKSFCRLYIHIYARVHLAVDTATGKGWRVDPAAAAKTGTSAG